MHYIDVASGSKWWPRISTSGFSSNIFKWFQFFQQKVKMFSSFLQLETIKKKLTKKKKNKKNKGELTIYLKVTMFDGMPFVLQDVSLAHLFKINATRTVAGRCSSIWWMQCLIIWLLFLECSWCIPGASINVSRKRRCLLNLFHSN